METATAQGPMHFRLLLLPRVDATARSTKIRLPAPRRAFDSSDLNINNDSLTVAVPLTPIHRRPHRVDPMHHMQRSPLAADARIFVQYCRQRHRVYVVTTSPIFSAPRATLAPATFHHSSERFFRYHYTRLPSLLPWLLHDIVLKLRCSSRHPQPADDRPWTMIPTVAHIIASKSYGPNKARGTHVRTGMSKCIL